MFALEYRCPRAARVYGAVIIIGCLAGCASGSCLSYGHSCWGAHGKRSGSGGVNGQWFVSRLAPSEPRAPPDVDPRTSLVMPPDSELVEDTRLQDSPDTRELIILEEPSRLYKLLNRLTSKMDLKSPENKK